MLSQVQVDEDIRRITARAIEEYGLIQLPTEFGPFLQQVRQVRPRTVVEIGTAKGSSIWAMGQVCSPDTVLITVDIEPVVMTGPFPAYTNDKPRPALGAVIRRDGRVIYRLIGNSQRRSTRRLVEAVMQLRGHESIDVLFIDVIDGDHSEAGVRRDFELFAPLVRPGGLVALHDIVDSACYRERGVAVYRLWSELEAAPEWDTVALNDQSDTLYYNRPAREVGGIGVARKRETAPAERAGVRAPWLVWSGYQPVFWLHMARHLMRKIPGKIGRG